MLDGCTQYSAEGAPPTKDVENEDTKKMETKTVIQTGDKCKKEHTCTASAVADLKVDDRVEAKWLGGNLIGAFFPGKITKVTEKDGKKTYDILYDKIGGCGAPVTSMHVHVANGQAGFRTDAFVVVVLLSVVYLKVCILKSCSSSRETGPPALP